MEHIKLLKEWAAMDPYPTEYTISAERMARLGAEVVATFAVSCPTAAKNYAGVTLRVADAD